MCTVTTTCDTPVLALWQTILVLLVVALADTSAARGQSEQRPPAPENPPKASATADQPTANRELQEADALAREFIRLRQAGKLEDAVKVGHRILEILGRAPGVDATIKDNVSDAVAECHMRRGEWRAAKELWQETIDRGTKLYGVDDYRVIDARWSLRNVELREHRTAEQQARFGDAFRLDKQATLRSQGGKIKDAIEIESRVVAVLGEILGESHPEYAKSLTNLAGYCRSSGDLQRAASLQSRSVEIQKKALGERHPDYATALNNLGALYQEMGDYAHAEPLLREVIEVEKATIGEENPSFATSLNNLAVLYAETGNFTRAEVLFKQVCAVRKQTLGEKHPDYATSLDSLASVYTHMGNYARAEALYLQARELLKESRGEAHPDYAATLSNLAVLYDEMGKYAAAAELDRRALEIRKKALGEQHPDYALSLNSLAFVYYRMGDYAQAEPLYLQALTIRKKVLGELHPAYAGTLNNLALLYEGMGNYAQAEPLFVQSLEIRRKTLGETHPSFADSMNNLANLRSTMGDDASAEQLFRLVLDIQQKSLGESHPRYALGLNNLADLYRKRGDYAQAEPLYRQALAIQQHALGEMNPDCALILSNLGVLYGDMGDYSKALPIQTQVLEIQQKLLGEKHPSVALSMNNLAHSYYELGDYERAEPLFVQAADRQRAAFGESNPDYCKTLGNLAQLYMKRGDDLRGEKLLREAVGTIKKSLGEKHPLYFLTLANLAELYRKSGAYEQAEPLLHQVVEYYERTSHDRDREYATCLNNLGLLELATGKPERAAKHFLRAIRIDRKRFELAGEAQSERQQLAMVDQSRSLLGSCLTAALVANVAPSDAYDEVAAWKGTITAQQQMLRIRRRTLAADPTSELATLFAELAGKTRRLAAIYRYSPKPEELDKFQTECFELCTSIESLQQRMSRLDPTFRQLWSERSALCNTLRKVLPAATALVDILEYSQAIPAAKQGGKEHAERRYLAFVLRNDKPTVWIELGACQPIDDLVDVFRGVSQSTNATGSASPGERLRQMVWQPMAAALSGATTVLIAPEGGLARLGWHALPGAKRGEYLIEECAIAVMPTPQLLPEILAASSASNASSLMLVGGVDFGAAPGAIQIGESRSSVSSQARISWTELPGTSAEAKDIQAIYSEQFTGSKPEVLEKGSATEEAVRKSASRHRYLHFATHGFFAPRPSYPTAPVKAGESQEYQSIQGENLPLLLPSLMSGIVLAGANRPIDLNHDDGIMTAFEVSELDLMGVELATLSACETGLGQAAGAEGLLGLQRAFQIAGARTVVSSLWKVPDRATQMLMGRFYGNLWKKKMGKLAALREAQIWMLREASALPELKRGLDVDSPNQFTDGTADASAGLPPHFWAAFVLSGDWR